VVDEERIIDPVAVYTRDTDWVRAADVLIAEVSVPSHGVGYEIAFALGLGKPVLCLCQQGRAVSKMITGNPDPLLKIAMYQTVEQAVQFARDFAVVKHL
jgi:nucleoside 2-deoxyribosyltransferase